MGFSDDLNSEVKRIFREQWARRDGYTIPSLESLKLNSNDAVDLKMTSVLYADMVESTSLVNGNSAPFAAEIYKTYLYCAAQIIKKNSGAITAYDGDRVMAVFDSSKHQTDAVKAALQLNYAVKNIINPALKSQYPDKDYVLQQKVGIDTSDLLVAKVGVRNDNDLVWIGRAANYAAKLCGVGENAFPTRITGAVYDGLESAAKYHDGKSMWTECSWKERAGLKYYRSEWSWSL
jgi:class 3 adenylate cyclase